jgi:hypothetical protein
VKVALSKALAKDGVITLNELGYSCSLMPST